MTCRVVFVASTKISRPSMLMTPSADVDASSMSVRIYRLVQA